MTKEQDFKQRFAAVLRDLQQDGTQDPTAMLLLGSLASDLARDLKVGNWTQAKQALTPASYNSLLKTFEIEGNDNHAAGRGTHAYVIQALAMSLVAATQRSDPAIATGEQLLDVIINSAITLYRNQPQPN